MKVLQIVNYIYPVIGGVEQVARDVANALKRIPGCEQRIICFKDGMENICDTMDGIPVIRCGCICKAASQPVSLAYPFALARLMREFRPDAVFFHYPNPLMAEFLLQHSSKPFRLFVYWHLDITRQKLLKKLFHGQNIRLIRRAEKILGATPVHLNESEYSEEFGDKKYVLPYMISTDFFQLTETDLAFSQKIRSENEGRTICFSIGRHVEYKGLRYLIKAAEYLDSSFRFYIAGEGRVTAELKELAVSDERIVFLGKISEAERRAYLHACDIFCFPSVTRNEAFGLALAEAMYMGKPAVTFTIPGSGVNYLNLNGVTGLECPNADCKSYAEAISRLASDPALRKAFGDAGRRRVEENYTSEEFVRGIRELLA